MSGGILGYLHWVVHCGALADAPVVDVPSVDAWGDRVCGLRVVGRQAHVADVKVQGHCGYIKTSAVHQSLAQSQSIGVRVIGHQPNVVASTEVHGHCAPGKALAYPVTRACNDLSG